MVGRRSSARGERARALRAETLRRAYAGYPPRRVIPPPPLLPVYNEVDAIPAGLRPLDMRATRRAPPAPCPPRQPRSTRPTVIAVGSVLCMGGASALAVAMTCGLPAARWRRVYMLPEQRTETIYTPYIDRLEAAGIEVVPFDVEQLASADLIFYWGDVVSNRITPGTNDWPPMVVFAHTAFAAGEQLLNVCSRHTVHGIGANGPAAAMIARVLGWEADDVPIAWTYADPPTPVPLRRRSPRSAGDPLVLGFVGRIAFEKNLGGLLGALEQLPPDVTLRIYGEGPFEERLRNSVAKAQLEERVELCGFAPDTAAIYETFDMLVVPSFFEGLPVVLVEAFMAGCPVITTRYGDIPYIAEHGARGFVADDPTPSGLARAIDGARAVDAVELVAITTRARAFAQAFLTEAEMVARVEAHLDAVLSGCRPRRKWTGAR